MTATAPELFPETRAAPEPPPNGPHRHRPAVMRRDRDGWYWEPDQGDRYPDLLAAATAATAAGMGPCVRPDWNRQ